MTIQHRRPVDASSPIQLRFSKLLARDQAALKSLAQRLTYKRRFDRVILDQIKNRPQLPRIAVAWSSLDISVGEIAVMEHDNPGNIAVAPEVLRNGHVELCRVEVRQFMETEGSLMTVHPFNFFLPVPGP
jgi:hypothetical protein